MSFARLDQKRIVVTGSSSGIGRAIALECARAGADLILTYRTSQAAAAEVSADIQALGRQVQVCQLDVSCPDSRTNFEQVVVDGGQIDAVVNNAGADLLTGALSEASFHEKLQTLLAVDVTGTVELARAFGLRFQQQGHGCILTVGWDQSDRGMEGDSGELFATAKNAIMGFTRSLSVSLAPEVRVNCIAPGWIQTAWGDHASEYWQNRVLNETPLKRWGRPEDIAATARFLLSEEASYMTGQVINVNGGAVR
ncbi:MAG TPA: 3-oxoacyl-ACP reductase [Planctomycetaceae bacterium]|nr:3-oxoacyl-ACP reductase [Planctomycetaceae bacterium]